MNQKFCEHLDEYEVAFGRAKASYGNCVNLVDKVIEDPSAPELRTTLENSLDEWVLETRKLRELFTKMTESGKIELTQDKEPDKPSGLNPASPICADCSFKLPRLEFTEFDLTDADNPTYRGQPLPQPVGAEV